MLVASSMAIDSYLRQHKREQSVPSKGEGERKREREKRSAKGSEKREDYKAMFR